MKLMDINGIWINVVNLVSNYMYHKPPIGDGYLPPISGGIGNGFLLAIPHYPHQSIAILKCEFKF